MNKMSKIKLDLLCPCGEKIDPENPRYASSRYLCCEGCFWADEWDKEQIKLWAETDSKKKEKKTTLKSKD